MTARTRTSSARPDDSGPAHHERGPTGEVARDGFTGAQHRTPSDAGSRRCGRADATPDVHPRRDVVAQSRRSADPESRRLGADRQHAWCRRDPVLRARRGGPHGRSPEGPEAPPDRLPAPGQDRVPALAALVAAAPRLVSHGRRARLRRGGDRLFDDDDPQACRLRQEADGHRLHADGKTPIGTFGIKRELVKIADLPDYVGNAVVASEDRTFWKNSGVSLTGILSLIHI